MREFISAIVNTAGYKPIFGYFDTGFVFILSRQEMYTAAEPDSEAPSDGPISSFSRMFRRFTIASLPWRMIK